MDPDASQRGGRPALSTPARGVALVHGIPIDDVTLDGAVAVIGDMIARGRAGGRSFQVATVNVDFVVNAHRDRETLAILQGADLCIADGMPIVWTARAAGTPLSGRVTGADLVPAVVERAAATGWRIVFLGGAPGVADAAAALMKERYGDVAVTGVPAPVLPTGNEVDEELLRRLDELRPDVICVAFGNPKQERWIAAHRRLVKGAVMIGVGGTLDFLVGERRRAPRWVQRSGLEWVYRAVQEPARLGPRYARDAVVFGPILVRAALSGVGGQARERNRRTTTEVATARAARRAGDAAAP
jgi:N-acetylglucosaminyldiphosphoundecaprenol N-acetyl-beta-D-mannosaminyltransferase